MYGQYKKEFLKHNNHESDLILQLNLTGEKKYRRGMSGLIKCEINWAG